MNYKRVIQMKKGIYCSVVAVLLTAAIFILPIANPGKTPYKDDSDHVGKSSAAITDRNNDTSSDPEIKTPKSDEIVTFIVETDGRPLSSIASSENKKISSLISSGKIREHIDSIKKNLAVVKAGIRKMLPEADLDGSYTYSTIITGFSVKAPYSYLSKLAKATGVKSVTLASLRKAVISEYEPTEDKIVMNNTESSADDSLNDNNDPVQDNDKKENKKAALSQREVKISSYTEPQNEMMKTASAYSEGYTGEGKVIAVIDDSFFCNHMAFSSVPDNCRINSGKLSDIIGAVPFNVNENDNPYVSKKIIFAYDYAGRDDDTSSLASDHGTMIAAASAGNNGLSGDEEFRSGAYDSQLVLMKVCKDGSDSINDEVLLAALDDAAKLSPDVLNLSIGVPDSGAASELYTKALKVLYENGCYITAAAGNYSSKTSGADPDGLSSSFTDYGTVSYPASLPFVTAAGSVDTEVHISDCLIADESERIEYSDVLDQKDKPSPSFSELNEYREYIYTDSFGSGSELLKYKLTGKIAVVKRGMLTIDEKIKAASESGAAGILIISDEPLYVRFTAGERTIPAAAVSSSSMKYFSDHPEGIIRASGKKAFFTCDEQSGPSLFSSYGVTNDLRLKPDILSPGTEIVSACIGGYNTISGTSVSSAEISACAAILMQYLPSSVKSDRQKVLTALLMNTANTLKYDDKLFYSPRLQGAGAVDLENAMAAKSYVTTADGYASVSMGGSATGEFSFDLTITSVSDEECTYQLSSQLQTDKLVNKNGEWLNTMLPESLSEYCEVVFTSDNKEINSVTVPASGKAEINVKITLSEPLKAAYAIAAPNGFFTDGFISFIPSNKSSVLTVPVCGYCGNWEDADIFDASVYDDKKPVIAKSSLTAASAIGKVYPGYVLGKNMTTGEFSSAKLCVGKDTVKNAYDVPTAGVSFVIPDFYLLRDASDYTITITDSSGKKVFSQNTGSFSALSNSGYEPYTELLSHFNADGLKNLFAGLKEGKYKYSVSASTVPAENNSSKPQTIAYDIVVDNTAPSKPVTKVYTDGERIFLNVSSTDKNGVQGLIFYTAEKSGNKYNYADRFEDLETAGYLDKNSYVLTEYKETETSAEYTYDITNIRTQLLNVKEVAKNENVGNITELKFIVRAVDYAWNLSAPVTADCVVSGTVKYKLEDQNGKPVEGAELSFNNVTKKSDRMGMIVFEDILPDYYGASLVSVPDDYKTDFVMEGVYTTLTRLNYERTIVFEFSGVYPETEVSDNKDTDKDNTDITNAELKKTSVRKDYFEHDNSVFGIVFVSILLIISISSLAISRRNRKTVRYYEKPGDQTDDTSDQ